MTRPESTPAAPHYVMSMVIIGVLFFIFGFVTWLNGPLTIFVKLAFHLDNVTAFLIPVAFYMSYFVLALPSAAVLKRTGMKRGMALGLFVMAIGAALFGQFIVLHSYHGALAALFVIGAGLSILQTASNPYVSILGPIESGARRVAIMGICNKGAGALAPLVFGWLVLSGIGSFEQQVKAAPTPAAAQALLDGFVARVYWPYMAMAAILAVLAVWVARSRLPEIRPAGANRASRGGRGQRGIFAFPHLWLGVVCLFIYVGMEVMAGDAIGVYGQALGLPLDAVKHFTTFTMVAMLAGYLAGLLLIPRFVSQQRYLAASAVLGVLLAFGAWSTTGYTSVAFVAALGFANAMMWPAIFPLAIKGLGGHTEFGSALLIMGIVGGALIPQAFFHLAEAVPLQWAFLLVMVPGYAYILFYGLLGHRAGQARTAQAVDSAAALP